MPGKENAIQKPINEPLQGASQVLKAVEDSHTSQEGTTHTRLHITPFTPALLKAYLTSSLQLLAQNVSYHAVETFPEKGFGYIDLPQMEAQKLKKKLNGATLKGSKVKIEHAKPEKRRAPVEPEVADESADRSVKRKKKSKSEEGVLEGAQLPNGRKVKRGWTEPASKSKKDKRGKRSKAEEKKSKHKESKYTRGSELLFKAKLTPVAASEVVAKGKKEKKKEKSKASSHQETIVHEFEQNTREPTFVKEREASAQKKEAVEYVNGKGWVDEDGNVVEAETGKARNRRVLELVDPIPAVATTDDLSRKSSTSKAEKIHNSTKRTPPSTPSESSEDSSPISSSSEDVTSASESEADLAGGQSSDNQAKIIPELVPPMSSLEMKEVHPLEALFKRPKSSAQLQLDLNSTVTPTKTLPPINTSFSFFGNHSGDKENDHEQSEIIDNLPVTPYTQRDLEWRGLRSAAPTPDTAAIGRRFSFAWRKGSQEADDADEDDDVEAETQLSINTKANASANALQDVEEEEVEGAEVIVGQEEGGDEEDLREKEPEESEFRRWFWENQGSLNRAWKKRRRDALKSKRLSDNRKAIGGRKVL